MLRLREIGSVAWGGQAGDVSLFLKTLDDTYKDDSYAVASVIALVTVNVTAGAGGGATSVELEDWIQHIVMGGKAGNPVESMTPRQLRTLLESCMLVPGASPDAVEAEEADVNRVILIQIPFHRPWLENPYESCPSVAQMLDQVIRVRLGGASINDDVNVNSASVRGFVQLIRTGSTHVAPVPEYRARTMPLSEELPDGIYDALAVHGSFSDAGELTNIILKAGTERLIDSCEPQSLTYAYAAGVTAGDSEIAIPIGGVDWVTDYASLTCLPLIYQSRVDRQVVRSVDTLGAELQYDMDGSLSTVTMLWCRRNPDLQAPRKAAEVNRPENRGKSGQVSDRAGKALPTMALANKPGLRSLAVKLGR